MASDTRLDPGEVVRTTRVLAERIRERFAQATLAGTAEGLAEIAEETARRTASISKPNIPLRIAIGILLAAIPLGLIVEIFILDLPVRLEGLEEAVAFFQAGVESLVFIGLAVAFLVTVESRIKRSRALAALHELREVAHVVDMHQLDKDPAYLVEQGKTTKSSPKRTMTVFELNRYLDYCSELLSLTGKVAALYAQSLNDPVALDAADQVESLTTGLSRKVWQKVMVLERAAG